MSDESESNGSGGTGNGTRNIQTNFTLRGIENAKKFMKSFSGVIGSGFKSAAGAVKNFSVGATKAIASISFRSMKFGVLGLTGALSAVGIKFSALTAIARKFTDETTTELLKLDGIAKASGESLSSIKTLDYAAKVNGGDPNELIKTLGNIAQNFGDIKNSIKEADDEWQKTSKWAQTGIIQAFKSGDFDKAKSILDDALSVRNKSLSGIEGRKQGIIAAVQATGRGGADYNNLIRAGYSDAQAEAAMSKRRYELVDEFKRLQQAEADIKKSFGNTGEALESLQKYGLNIDKAMSGGAEALNEIADALDRMPDSAEKLNLAQKLFGGDAAAKNLALLRGGSKAIAAFKKELESLGAMPTQADADQASNLDRSRQRRTAAFEGVKLETTRQLSPLLEETNNQIAQWMAKNRTAIARVIGDAFTAIRTLFYDVVKLINGDTNFESTLFKKGQTVLVYVRGLVVQLSAFVGQAYDEVLKVLNGQDSNWEFLNTIRDGIVYIGDLARKVFDDVVAIFQGKRAVNFPWLNDLNAGFQHFKKSLMDAWNGFKKVLDGIHSFIKPVLNFFGYDILTAGLFLGMLKFSGILGGILAIIGKIAPAFAGLFTGVVSGTGAAGAAVAGMLTTALGGIAAFGAATYLAVTWLSNKVEEKEDKYRDKIAAVMRENDRRHLASRGEYFKNQGDLTRSRQYFEMAGVDMGPDTAAEHINRFQGWSREDANGNLVSVTDALWEQKRQRDLEYAASRKQGQQPRGRTVQLNVSLNGQNGTFYGDEYSEFMKAFDKANRGGGL